MNEIDIWRMDATAEILLSNAGTRPTYASEHLGKAATWALAYLIARPIAVRLGYRLIEHDINEAADDDIPD